MNGKKLPAFIVDVLKYSGFDTKIALANINSEDINAIEKFIDENSTKFVESFKNSVYENIKPFKFIPGHRALILNIPIVLKEHEVLKKPKSTRKELSENELKELLISKIQNYEQKYHYEFKLTIDDIKSFETVNGEYKCYVNCKFCAKSFLCTFKMHWMTSNLFKHLKTHFEEIEIQSVRSYARNGQENNLNLENESDF